MRVVLADPPAYTLSYDRSLAAALARAGADVELVTSRFPFRGRRVPGRIHGPRVGSILSRLGCGGRGSGSR